MAATQTAVKPEKSLQARQLERMMKETEMSAADRYAYLQSEFRRVQNDLKAAKEALPVLTPLEKVEAKQAGKFNVWATRYVAERATERIAAGQPTEEAVDAVLARMRGKVIIALAKLADAQAES